MKPILEIQNISKKFRIRHEKQTYLSLRESITSVFKKSTSTNEDFYALKNVSFNVYEGDTIGIIGKNGAGKSTLLKILSKITPPTSGKIISRGRIASLLEVGTGFHPELSGRENVFLNGSILGMKRSEIHKNFDSIIDFSGVEKFIDTPLKHYSSGMQLRLAFAVAAFLENEILIVDEVLAVGDAEFQKKCMGKMEDVSKSGRTILFVSHNMEAIQSLCKKGIFLKNGAVNFSGNADECIGQYLNNILNEQVLHFKPSIASEKNGFSILEAYVSTKKDHKKIIYNSDDINIHFKFINHELKKFSAYMFVYRNESLAFIASDLHDPCSDKINDTDPHEIIFNIPKYLLNSGNCSIGLLLADYNGNTEQFINHMNLLSFNVEDDGFRRGNKYNLGWSGSVSPILNVSTKAVL